MVVYIYWYLYIGMYIYIYRYIYIGIYILTSRVLPFVYKLKAISLPLLLHSLSLPLLAFLLEDVCACVSGDVA